MFWVLIKKCNVLWDKIRLKRYPNFHILAPAQRAAGGCSPLKATPGRGPAARRTEVEVTSIHLRCHLCSDWYMTSLYNFIGKYVFIIYFILTDT